VLVDKLLGSEDRSGRPIGRGAALQFGERTENRRGVLDLLKGILLLELGVAEKGSER